MFGPPPGLEQVFTHLPVSVWTTDAELRITYVAETARALGMREGDVVGHTAINSVLDNRADATILQAFARALRGERGSFRTQYHDHWYYARIEPLRDERDRIVGTVGAILDVTADTSRNSGYRSSDTQLDVAQRLSGVGSWRLDYSSREATVTAQYESITGRVFSNPTTFDAIFDTIAGEDRARFLAAFEASREKGVPYDLHHRIVREDGSLRDVRARGTFAFENGEVASVIGTIADVTDQMTLDRALSALTYHDALTGLPNEALLRDRLTREIARAQRSGSMVALLAIEPDRFAEATQALGLPVAERFLVEISKRLGAPVRPSDLVGRQGEAGFVLILPDIREPAQVASALKRVRESLDEPLVSGVHELPVTVSVGVAIYPNDGHETASLMRNGVAAMRKARESGGGGFRYHSDAMHEAVARRLDMDQRLRTAIGERSMNVCYQPVVELPSGRVCGLEALLRWPASGDDQVEPRTFIALAEDYGLIDRLGEYVLRAALAQSRAFTSASTREVRISVNVSARQFTNASFPAALAEIIRSENVDPGILDLEVPESTFATHMEITATNLQAVRDLGVGVTIDDFGTAQNSLFYLKNLPVTAIKIGAAFIADIGVDSRTEAIVQSVISLAHALGLRVVGKGVETPEQLAFLQRAGCDAYQGFLYSPAVAAAEALRFYANGSAQLVTTPD